MGKLWQKNYELNKLVEEFTVGRDYILDKDLVTSDCVSSIAHATMLESIGILDSKDLTALKKGFNEILDLQEKGDFPIKPGDEDCHTAIENFLTASIGDAGKKIHTGRSRNDQVITALRVFSRSKLIQISQQTLSLVGAFFDFAKKNKDVPMPGRTHMQIAMPSSVGLWAAAFGEELLDTVRNLYGVYSILDQCPLGSAASYGVPLPLNREMTSDLLGFSRIQNNVLYVNNSRGKMESYVLDALDQIGLTLSKAAQDLILFSLPEFGYFSLPDQLCSGSSIMPQKKNPDALELMRAKSGTLSAYAVQVKNIIRSLPTGYNRDFQETKEPLMRGTQLAEQMIGIMELTIKELQVNEDRLRGAFTSDIYATDRALELVASGISFRDAYKQVGLDLASLKSRNPETCLANRLSSGMAGNLQLEQQEKELESLDSLFNEKETRIEGVFNGLCGRKVFILT